MIKLLLDAGADPNKKFGMSLSSERKYLIDEAIDRGGNLEIIRLLLNAIEREGS